MEPVDLPIVMAPGWPSSTTTARLLRLPVQATLFTKHRKRTGTFVLDLTGSCSEKSAEAREPYDGFGKRPVDARSR